MTWADDFVSIISDHAETLTIQRLTPTYVTGKPATEVWGDEQTTFEGDWQPADGSTMRSEAGMKIKSTSFIMSPIDCGVLDKDRIKRADGSFEYVNYIKRYSGHWTIFMKKQKGSN